MKTVGKFADFQNQARGVHFSRFSHWSPGIAWGTMQSVLASAQDSKGGIVRKLGFAGTACLVLMFCAATVITATAQTLTTLDNFDYTDGSMPYAGLVQASNGNLYGTTYYGGASGYGTVFKIDPSGTLTTLHSFDYTDGEYTESGLVEDTKGSLYGTTFQGGADGKGTVFKITQSGTLATLYNFCSQSDCTDGGNPTAGLVQATNGDIYGTTISGGAYDFGTVFKITPGGALTTLYSFCSQSGCADGDFPYAGLIQATNGNLYGTTYTGGAHGYGTVFKITPSGTLTTLHSFDYTDGEQVYAGLVQASDGNFYGTTLRGGAQDDGTVFKITSAGTLTTLYSFCSLSGCTDGANPVAGLVQATDGNLYGTTQNGGSIDGDGTIFKITTSGVLTTLYSFCNPNSDGCTAGSLPDAGLLQDTNGKFYGTTYQGGTDLEGTIFSLSVGLGQFVETLPTSGKVGATVEILGTDLTGATSVTFNGTAATFTVVSSTEIKTIVPAGATTGRVEMATPGGTLKSNLNFRVP